MERRADLVLLLEVIRSASRVNRTLSVSRRTTNRWAPCPSSMPAGKISSLDVLEQVPQPSHGRQFQGDDPPGLGDLRQPDGQLRLGHAVVEADAGHAELGPAVDVSKGLLLPHGLGEVGVVGRHGPAFAQRGDVLVRLEAVAARLAGSADRPPLVARPHGMGGVVDHRNAGLAADRLEPVDVGRMAREMNGEDGLRPRTDLVAHGRRVQAERFRIDVREHDPRSPRRRAGGRADERERRGDHFILRPDPQDHHAGVERRAAGIEGHGVPGPLVLGEGLLEFRLFGHGEEAAVGLGRRLERRAWPPPRRPLQTAPPRERKGTDRRLMDMAIPRRVKATACRRNPGGRA